MDEHIEPVTDILRPDSPHKADCEREVSEAIRRIREVRIFSEPKRQLLSDSKKLIAAKRVIDRHLAAYGPCTGATDALALHLGLLGKMLAELADAGECRGRDRAIDYRRKYFAGQRAFALLLRWSPRRPPTLAKGGDFFNMTAALYAGATGEEAGELETACAEVLHSAEKDGYKPDKPEQFLQRLPWDIPL